MALLESYSQPVRPAILAAFAPILTHRDIAKHERLHEAGKDGRHLYFVESGILRAYYLLDGRDVTAHFAVAGDSITSPDSFIRCQASKYFIEALADTVAYVIERGQLDNFLERHPEHERLARLYTEEMYMDLLRRSESLTFLTARQRYTNLLEAKAGGLATGTVGPRSLLPGYEPGDPQSGPGGAVAF
ncbi:MAG: Crp/Fnr family transcriptional regulator [Lewinella sp.]